MANGPMLTSTGSKSGNGRTESGIVRDPQWASRYGDAGSGRLRQGLRLAAADRHRHCVRNLLDRAETTMTQTSNRFFDEIARLMNDAAGVASGVRREFDTLVRSQADRVLRELDLVQREEFEAVKEMARLAREENEALQARLAALEARLAAKGAGEAPAAPPTTP